MEAAATGLGDTDEPARSPTVVSPSAAGQAMESMAEPGTGPRAASAADMLPGSPSPEGSAPPSGRAKRRAWLLAAISRRHRLRGSARRPQRRARAIQVAALLVNLRAEQGENVSADAQTQAGGPRLLPAAHEPPAGGGLPRRVPGAARLPPTRLEAPHTVPDNTPGDVGPTALAEAADANEATADGVAVPDPATLCAKEEPRTLKRTGQRPTVR